MEARSLAEPTRACLFAVVERFNTEEPFWCSFVPEPEQTRLAPDAFSVTLRGCGLEFEVTGTLVESSGAPGGVRPTVVVGARPSARESPRHWHQVTCTVDSAGRFTTSDFRKAIEASIEDVRAHASC
jgi:hypothetical protein